MWDVNVNNVVTGLTGVSPIPVSGTATVYCQSVKIGKGVYFGIRAQCSTTGTPSVMIVLEESDVLPVNEGQSDANFAVPDSLANLWTQIADTKIHRITLSPITAKYARLKIIGTSTNPGDCTVTAGISIQEEME